MSSGCASSGGVIAGLCVNSHTFHSSSSLPCPLVVAVGDPGLHIQGASHCRHDPHCCLPLLPARRCRGWEILGSHIHSGCNTLPAGSKTKSTLRTIPALSPLQWEIRALVVGSPLLTMPSTPPLLHIYIMCRQQMSDITQNPKPHVHAYPGIVMGVTV